MSTFNLSHTGQQVDDAITKVRFDTVAALITYLQALSALPSTGTVFITNGRTTAGDTPTRTMTLKDASHTDNGGTIRTVSGTKHLELTDWDGDVRDFGVVGDGVTDDKVALQKAIDAAATNSVEVRLQNKEYFLNSSSTNVELLTIPSNTVINGNGANINGKTVVGSSFATGNINIEGTRTSTTSDLTASVVRGVNTVTVADASGFTAGDKITIQAPTDEGENSDSGKVAPTELNEIASIATNTLTLKFPLSHDYNIAADHTGSDSSTVRKISAIKENILIKDVELNVFVRFALVDGMEFRGCTMPRTLNFASSDAGSFADDPSRNITIDLDISAVRSPSTGPDENVGLYNITNLNANIRTYGGFKDGIRVHGCTDGIIKANISECANRPIHMYKSQNIVLDAPIITGTIVDATEYELILFDACRYCLARDIYIDEVGKTGSELGSFRGKCVGCSYDGGYASVHSDRAFEIKTNTYGCSIKNLTLELRGSRSGDTIQFVFISSGAINEDKFNLKVTGNTVVNATTVNPSSFIGIRTTSTTNYTTNGPKYIEFSNNTLPLFDGSFVSIAGDSASEAIHQLKIFGNHATQVDSNCDPIAVTGITTNDVYIANNYFEEVGSQIRYILSSATNIFIEESTFISPKISNYTTAKINGMWIAEGSGNPSFVTNPRYQRGNLLSWKDTSSSTNKVYIVADDHDTGSSSSAQNTGREFTQLSN
jgi:hypothetical protein